MMFEIEASGADALHPWQRVRVSRCRAFLGARCLRDTSLVTAGPSQLTRCTSLGDCSGSIGCVFSKGVGVKNSSFRSYLQSWLMLAPRLLIFPGSAIYFKEQQPEDVSQHVLHHLRSPRLLISPGSAIYFKEQQPEDVSQHILQRLRFCNSFLKLE
ncbi:uncharacterized protein LOC141728445 isoform X1 [Zonotrichia albicollis]|uniref:uncharacterized protein LOC141728445 isoform X1 n=1 Tax=Zonotrichia albicollis TaxID=44394 RepID=UPI003D811962